jgi:hypothetical protein
MTREKLGACRAGVFVVRLGWSQKASELSSSFGPQDHKSSIAWSVEFAIEYLATFAAKIIDRWRDRKFDRTVVIFEWKFYG